MNEPLCEFCISRHASPFRLPRWTQIQSQAANLQRAEHFASLDLAVSEDWAVRVSNLILIFATRQLEWEVIIVVLVGPRKQLAKATKKWNLRFLFLLLLSVSDMKTHTCRLLSRVLENLVRVCFFISEWGYNFNCVNTGTYIHGLNFVTGDFVIIMDADFSQSVCASLLSIVVSKVFIPSLHLSLNLFGKVPLSSFLHL